MGVAGINYHLLNLARLKSPFEVRAKFIIFFTSFETYKSDKARSLIGRGFFKILITIYFLPRYNDPSTLYNFVVAIHYFVLRGFSLGLHTHIPVSLDTGAYILPKRFFFEKERI